MYVLLVFNKQKIDGNISEIVLVNQSSFLDP